MKYMGSKNRIAREILPIMLKDRKEGQWFIDLFCGGCNLSDKVGGRVVANDKNKYLIAMFEGLQKNAPRPKVIDKSLYSSVRDVYNGKEPCFVQDMFTDDFLIGWVGWMGSYNGRFFDGGYSGHDVKGRDYIGEQIRNTEKQMENLMGVRFFSRDFDGFDFKEPCIIYCDPPYEGTKQYSTSKDFDHSYFWQWCREQKEKGHSVFVSEYNAPADFKCIWQKEVTNSLNTSKTYRPIEKLFTL